MKKIKIFLLFSFIITLILTSGFSKSAIRLGETKSAFVTSGQSNMKGTEPYLKFFLKDYYVITCSVGKTSISEWQKGTPNYNKCLEKVRVAQASGYKIIGMFHYQGEKDTKDDIVSADWDILTLKFFNDFRKDIGADSIRVVYAQLGKPVPSIYSPYWYRVMAKQTNLLSLDPTLRMIITKDITPYCKGVHWCAEGYEKIARRFILSFFTP